MDHLELIKLEYETRISQIVISIVSTIGITITSSILAKIKSFTPNLSCPQLHRYLLQEQKQEKKELNLTGYTQITERFIYNRFIRLGGGSFGTVYRGYDSEAKRFIAVKQIQRVNLYGLPPGELKEIQIMKQLKHPNIMAFYGSYGDRFNPEGIFMFLELCEKGTLADLINKKITEKQTYELLRQLVDGMAYMHEKKKFHRDLKPENLLITANLELKIADFGIAREIQQGHKTFKKCTPIYSAPEVYVQEIFENNSEVYNEKCDVFSAGYILYEMLTSQQLNKGIKTAEELKNFLIKNKNQGGFNFQHPSLTAKWIELLRYMLNFDFAKRPSFNTIKLLLKNFSPALDKLPQVRPQSQNKVKESEVLTKKVKKLVQLINNRNNYLVNVLKVLNRYQQERSEFIPKVYKILLLYFTLARYCYLAEDGIKQISDKELFILPDSGQNLIEIQEMLTLEDRVNVGNYLKALADRINEGKEQMKLFVSNFVITQISEILRYPQTHIERRLLSEFNIEGGIKTFKVNEFEMDSFYQGGARKCINNLYRTAAQLEVLTDPDLRIYLVCLYVANIDRYVDIQNYETCSLPPKYEDILSMQRKQLENFISIEKNKK